MRRNFDFRPLLLAGLVCAVAMGGLMGCSRGSAGDDADNVDKLFTVRKSDLVIGTLLRGIANAKETHKLAPEAAFKNILTWIEEENTHVKKDAVVVKFETQALLDEIADRKLKVELMKKSLDINAEEMRIQRSENESQLRVAMDSVTSAEESYARYYKYDGKNARDKMEEEVSSRRAALTSAKDKYQDSLDEVSNTIYEDEATRQKALEKLDLLKADRKKKEQDYENSIYALKIFKKYTYPNTLTDTENKLIQAKLNLEKIKVSTASKIVQKENVINRNENELKKELLELEKFEGYLPMMEIVAPVDGILVYGDIGSRRDRNMTIEIGMEVRRKRVIASIPEMDNLIIDFELPEQFRHRITEGAAAFIKPDSMPSLKLTGKVSKIAVVPVNQIEWDRTSPKIYRSEITLDQQEESFVSGMNVQIEIIEETILNAVNVPVEAVFEEEGEYFVYLRTNTKTKKQIVEVGKSNDRYVHITEGLKEGDQVYLFSPYELGSSES